MKRMFGLGVVVLLWCSAAYGFDFGKIIEHSVKRTDKKAERSVEGKIDQTVDGAFQTVEDAVSGDGKPSKSSKKSSRSSKKSDTITNDDTQSTEGQSSGVVGWSSYDFVSGDNIIFEDTLKGERNGEFPSRWELTKGTVENATLDGENVIYFIKCNANSGCITPLLSNSDKDYLPEEFTIELDAYFENDSQGSYVLHLADMKNQQRLDTTVRGNDKWIRFGKNGAEHRGNVSRTYYPGTNSRTKSGPGWRHVSLSFNKRALKLYIDDARVMNVPNLGYNPTGITLGFHNPNGGIKSYIKNMRVAQGAVPLYDKVMSDGRIVTTGIRFDVNQATIKPESTGVIMEIVALMQKNPGLNFSIEGHTDSDGEENTNLSLSEKRAEAIRDSFVARGIDSSRLRTKGWGETKPIADNTTADGKANNRRVEFIKFN
ncbi:MAG: OmpA family protein [Desulfuromonadaceae bacterium]|nr:OmpA family protein [Desulfuromonadaceae bacterium]MDD5105706.1 OmpA family protein [Desulfuromonadaceae bacterium]